MHGKILTTHNGVLWHYHISSRGFRERQYEIRLTDWTWERLDISIQAKRD